eukprot:1158518-Pelagomonas_calceolata.AAC.1
MRPAAKLLQKCMRTRCRQMRCGAERAVTHQRFCDTQRAATRERGSDQGCEPWRTNKLAGWTQL